MERSCAVVQLTPQKAGVAVVFLLIGRKRVFFLFSASMFFHGRRLLIRDIKINFKRGLLPETTRLLLSNDSKAMTLNFKGGLMPPDTTRLLLANDSTPMILSIDFVPLHVHVLQEPKIMKLELELKLNFPSQGHNFSLKALI